MHRDMILGNQKIKQPLDREDISLPFPQCGLHVCAVDTSKAVG